MATIPSFADWTRKTTLGALKPRSSELKTVDVAIKLFEADRNGTALKALALSWNAWKRTKADWKTSERNKEHILEQLDAGIAERLGPVGGRPMSEDEKKGIIYMDQQRRLAVQRMFKGKKVKLKLLSPVNEARKQLKALKDANKGIGVAGSVVKSSGPSIGRGAASSAATGGAMSTAKAAIESMLSSFFDVASFNVIGPFLMETFGADLVSSMTPVVGHLKSAAGVITSWGTVGKKKWDEVSNRKHKAFVGAGASDAGKAFDALDRLLTGEVGNAAIGATMKTTAFAARSLLVLADGGAVSGPIVGAAEALASLTFRIYQLAGEYKETRRANMLLRTSENLDFRLFDAYPLLGCYMLASATLSDIMNMTMVEFGGYGWMDDVEFIKKTHIDPVRKRAFTLIDNSVFEVEGMSPLVQASKAKKLMSAAKVVKSLKVAV